MLFQEPEKSVFRKLLDEKLQSESPVKFTNEFGKEEIPHVGPLVFDANSLVNSQEHLFQRASAIEEKLKSDPAKTAEGTLEIVAAIKESAIDNATQVTALVAEIQTANKKLGEITSRLEEQERIASEHVNVSRRGFGKVAGNTENSDTFQLASFIVALAAFFMAVFAACR